MRENTLVKVLLNHSRLCLKTRRYDVYNTDESIFVSKHG